MDATYSYSYSSDLDPGMFMALTVVWLVVVLVMVASLWKIFDKAGKPGWASIVPIYNVIVLLEIVGRPMWWLLLFFVPVANFVVAIILAFDLAKAFGQGAGFGIGLLLLPFVFYPLLAFGGSSYAGGSAIAAQPSY